MIFSLMNESHDMKYLLMYWAGDWCIAIQYYKLEKLGNLFLSFQF